MKAADQIVTLLREAEGGEVSSRVLCERLGITRAAVWKQVEALRAAGYAIEACTRRGYRLVGAPDRPCAAEVLPLLATRRLGRDLRYLAETGSTNRDIAVLAQAGAQEGVTVVADRQNAGRGRMTRAWFSPPEVNLYVSLLLRPEIEPGRAASLPLVAGLAVAEALEQVAPGCTPRIKWPNDILSGGRKICGVLCEMQAEADRVRYIIPGLGVNVNLTRAMLPAELRERATSLRIEAGHAFSRAAVLAAIMSTVSSQLLVSSSAIAEDFWKRLFRKQAGERELLNAGRVSVLVISVVAMLLALGRDSTVLALVAYAWAGFGAAFGPVVLFSLFWGRMTRNGALAGMIFGAVTVIVWKHLSGGLFEIYEILPGFLTASLVIILVSLAGARPAEDILETHGAARAG